MVDLYLKAFDVAKNCFYNDDIKTWYPKIIDYKNGIKASSYGGCVSEWKIQIGKVTMGVDVWNSYLMYKNIERFPCPRNIHTFRDVNICIVYFKYIRCMSKKECIIEIERMPISKDLVVFLNEHISYFYG